MNKIMLLIGVTMLLKHCDGLVLPTEVFSLIVAVSKIIPIITKGTDSRIGVGFRLGAHADFQTIVELGPQKFTKPLGEDSTENIGGYDIIKRTVKQSERTKVTKPTYGKSNQWIQNTANEMKDKKSIQNSQNIRFAEKSPFGLKDQYPIPRASTINTSSLRQMQELYSKLNEQPNQISEHAIGTSI